MNKNYSLLAAFIVNSIFVVVELYYAFESGSLALLADAIHMITDSISIGIALGVSYLSMKVADQDRTFGYHRLEILGGLANSILLFGTLLYVLYESYTRFLQGTPAIDGTILFIVGGVGLLANLVAAYFLHDHNESVNVRGAYLHLLADAFGSIGAIGAGLAVIITEQPLIDVLVALIITLIIGYSALNLFRESVHILLQGTPSEIDIPEITETLQSEPQVTDVHHFHVWSLDGETTAASVHIVVTDETTIQTALETYTQILLDAGIDHPTIQIETTAFDSEHSCYQLSEIDTAE